VNASVAWPAAVAADRHATASALPVGAPSTVVDERVDTDPLWDVIVWDDPVNLMSYVVVVFRRVFGFSLERARALMLQVHTEGRAVVATEAREPAELHVGQLHRHGLHATMERVR
jgi:ATP-dependent Clp protease adaptor protein ClpS